MTAWTLVIYMGISWAGPGSVAVGIYESEAACYKALAAMKVSTGAPVESDNRRDVVAFCRPTKTGDR